MPSAFDGYEPREKVTHKIKCEFCDGHGYGNPARTPQGDIEEQPCPKCKGEGFKVVEL